MNIATKAHLILFTRYPEAGRTKTRLIPALGPMGAAELQRRMTEYTLSVMTRFINGFPVTAEIRFDGGSRDRMAAWLASDIPCIPQGDGDLGARLASAFAAAFAEGARRVGGIGAHCPGLTGDLLCEAFTALTRHDLVLGPATDGGYYLLGLSREAPAIFPGVPWGSTGVLAATLAGAEALALSSHLLEPLTDVDRPEDLHHFDNHPDPQ
jgi:uncharacterized protein